MPQPENPVGDSLAKLAVQIAGRDLPCLVIGGNSAIHHGVPRFTRDIDLLIPETSAEVWYSHLLQNGYRRIHASNAFQQFNPSEPDLPPIDLMIVSEATWQKLLNDSETIPFQSASLGTPSALHLICLKLHATRSPFRLDTTVDWQDIETLAKLHHIDPSDPETAALLNRYGGENAANQLSERISHQP